MTTKENWLMMTVTVVVTISLLIIIGLPLWVLKSVLDGIVMGIQGFEAALEDWYE